MAKSVPRMFTFSLRANPFSVSQFIHESEDDRFRQELEESGPHLTEPSPRAQETIISPHWRQDSKSSFILHKERKQIPGLREKAETRRREEGEELSEIRTLLKPRGRSVRLRGDSSIRLNLSILNDPTVTPADTSSSPTRTRRQLTLCKGSSRDFSLDSLTASKRELRSLCQQSALKSVISKCKVLETAGKHELKALEKTKDTESKAVKKFLETVKYLQDLDLYQAHVLPKVYSHKVNQEEFNKSEAERVLKEYRYQQSDPFRPSARLSLHRRKYRACD